MREAKEILGLTKKLMGFRTTSDNPEEIRRCMDFIEDYFSGSDVVLKRHMFGNKPSIIVTFRKTKKPELFLVAHVDVVPCPDYFFKPKIKGKLLFGRGGHDDKGSVAIMMVLGKYYSKQKKIPDMGLMFVSDEEIGSRYGVQTLLSRGYSSKFALILDGGRDDEIVTKEKAPLHIKITTKGRTSHGSTPWEGENAIEKLRDFYNQLRAKFPKKFGEWSNTISLGTFQGGSVVNQVPDSAEMSIDMRFISEKDKSAILRFIRSSKGIQSEILSDGTLLNVSKDNRYIKGLAKSISKVLSKKPRFGRLSGATDARHFVARKIPSVLMMPTGKNAHSLKEYVDTESFGRLYLILRNFIDSNIGEFG